MCLAGVTLAGLGTGVCAPAIISAAGTAVPTRERGAAVSTVMTIAYLGFVAGPAVVGLVAGRVGLRAGLGTVAALAGVLALAAAVIPASKPSEAAVRPADPAVSHSSPSDTSPADRST